MKETSFIPAVITADQVNSRQSPDAVPEALAALGALSPGLLLGFERTAGDEIQCLAADPEIIINAVVTLSRLPDWRIGIGLGPVESPLPKSTREARGPAYLAARTAINRARKLPGAIAVVEWSAPETTVGDGTYGESRSAESALILLRAILARRTPEGWQLMDALQVAGSGKAAAALLGITPSAVSQRRRAAALAEAERAIELSGQLLGQAMRTLR